MCHSDLDSARSSSPRIPRTHIDELEKLLANRPNSLDSMDLAERSGPPTLLLISEPRLGFVLFFPCFVLTFFGVNPAVSCYSVKYCALAHAF
ncbi:hypothetical protein DENSPDRAFT_835005 [Dentipellis sp. KUC8613]|nr:hypothetical protein DENSPDRAFT_835005 [Dentipellis sp. KUC8613]